MAALRYIMLTRINTLPFSCTAHDNTISGFRVICNTQQHQIVIDKTQQHFHSSTPTNSFHTWTPRIQPCINQNTNNFFDLTFNVTFKFMTHPLSLGFHLGYHFKHNPTLLISQETPLGSSELRNIRTSILNFF